MSCAPGTTVYRAFLAALLLGTTDLTACAKEFAVPIIPPPSRRAQVDTGRSSAVPDEDSNFIEAAADALAEMSMRLPELPDLPEHLEYLVRDTDDGAEVVLVPAGTQAGLQANKNAPSFIDTELSLDEPQESSLEQSPESPDTVISVQTGKKITPETVVDLNRFNFHNNVLREGHDQPQHWIIRFCHDWYEPCDELTDIFKQSAIEVETMLNANDRFQTTVRFADVDCSTNKPLCNEVADYHFPQIIHFHEQKRLTDWKGGGNTQANAQRFLKWVAMRAEYIESEMATQKKTNKVVREVPSGTIAPWQWELKHMIAVFIATAAALAGYFWFLVRKLTGINCSSVQTNVAKLHSVPSGTLPRKTRMRTCHDMYPDDWLPRRSGSEAVIEL